MTTTTITQLSASESNLEGAIKNCLYVLECFAEESQQLMIYCDDAMARRAIYEMAAWVRHLRVAIRDKDDLRISNLADEFEKNNSGDTKEDVAVAHAGRAAQSSDLCYVLACSHLVYSNYIPLFESVAARSYVNDWIKMFMAMSDFFQMLDNGCDEQFAEKMYQWALNPPRINGGAMNAKPAGQ